ncbi:O-antigen ligase family protein [Rhodanobacter sp. AS-Z3]|uniref:O-antigen ligase family protein n=1 Tax=Rhodanobacter sp. AS-Z3 TaxID=3031330 RepID=UPI00247A3AAD|nr:O-antigen ligase family protein [Rhodanobacter sp. AS-Z3]WEN15741.1 O-antigen ligase family protein [Rhodanobacter sp. AS-Z3]
MQATLNSWKGWTLSILVALVPLSVSIDIRLKALPAAALFLAGLASIARFRQVRDSYRSASSVVWAILAMTLFMIINATLHHSGWRPLDSPAHLLLYLVAAAAFALPLRMSLVWAGFSLTAATLGLICVIQFSVLDIDRPYGLNGGASASIALATVLLGLSLLAMSQLFHSMACTAEKILHATAVLLSLFGALLTQSRGPLLAFLPMAVFLLFLQSWRTGRWRRSLLMVGGFCCLACVTAFVLHGSLLARFESIRPEVATFEHHDQTPGAVRERLAMWRTASHAFVEHPLTGIGPNQFEEYARTEIQAGRSSPIIAGYNQPHNQYLQAASSGGIPGVLVLLLVFLVPLRYFARHVRDSDDGVGLPAAAGMAVIGLYVLCALTDSVFYRVMPQSFYFFTISGLALLIARRLNMRTDRPENAHWGRAHGGRLALPNGTPPVIEQKQTD